MKSVSLDKKTGNNLRVRSKTFFSKKKGQKNRQKIVDFFDQNAPVRCMLHSHDFSVEKSVFSDFLAKNQRFYRFFADFFTSDYLLQKYFPCRLKTNFSTIFKPKNPIFFVLGYM